MNHAAIRELRISQVEAYRSSGQPAKVWCEENQLNLHTLKYWIRKLNCQEKDDHRPQWVSLMQESPSSSNLTIRVGSIAIEVTNGFDPQLLVEVIQVIRATC